MGLQLMFPKMETCVLTSREVAPKTIKSLFLGIFFVLKVWSGSERF